MVIADEDAGYELGVSVWFAVAMAIIGAAAFGFYVLIWLAGMVLG
jgi:hypothetical protein